MHDELSQRQDIATPFLRSWQDQASSALAILSADGSQGKAAAQHQESCGGVEWLARISEEKAVMS
jgi:hypothetical protein